MAGPYSKDKIKMNMPAKKSQVTMLMIVGLVLFITVGLVLYLSKSAVKKTTKETIKKSQETAIETQPIKEYVDKCLDKLTKDALTLLGKQGGYLYKSQGGPIIDYQETDIGKYFLKYDNLYASYNIMPPKFSAGTYASEIPDYPWVTFPYPNAESNNKIFTGFFGITNMPPLNSSNGPNSIQEQIEIFIDNNIATCANFDIFKGQGLDVVMHTANTSIVIGSNDISAISKISVTINNPKLKEISELNDFSANAQVDLKDLYYFTKQLISNDIKNITFNISDIKNNNAPFSIQVSHDIFSQDDLIIITDENSLIYGKPYKYIFSRRNRAPALYYIKNNILQFEHLHPITKEDLLQGQELKAEDPDEDLLTFKIKLDEREAEFPVTLNRPQMNFRVEASDGKLSDYQIITVNRIETD